MLAVGSPSNKTKTTFTVMLSNNVTAMQLLQYYQLVYVFLSLFPYSKKHKDVYLYQLECVFALTYTHIFCFLASRFWCGQIAMQKHLVSLYCRG